MDVKVWKKLISTVSAKSGKVYRPSGFRLLLSYLPDRPEQAPSSALQQNDHGRVLIALENEFKGVSGLM